MRAVITVFGKDRVGIIAGISNILADSNVNILDISQILMQDVFTLIMLTDVSNTKVPFDVLSDTLEAMTCVCSVGLDMIVVPGDTTAETISAVIANEMAIGVVNNKTTVVRIIPAPGKKAGELVEFGGLLGTGPLMTLNKYSSSDFIKRGGRIPAPIISLRN